MEHTVWVAESVPAYLVFKDEEPPAVPGVGAITILRHRARKTAAGAMCNYLHHLGRRQRPLSALLGATGDAFSASARCDPSLAPVVRIGDRVYRLRQDTDITPEPPTQVGGQEGTP